MRRKAVSNRSFAMAASLSRPPWPDRIREKLIEYSRAREQISGLHVFPVRMMIAKQRDFSFGKMPPNRPHRRQRHHGVTKLPDAENENLHKLNDIIGKLRPWLIAANLAKPLSIPMNPSNFVEQHQILRRKRTRRTRLPICESQCPPFSSAS